MTRLATPVFDETVPGSHSTGCGPVSASRLTRKMFEISESGT
jgi:hypothetical protein